MSVPILRLRGEDGQMHGVPCLQGPQGVPGEQGPKGEAGIYYGVEEPTHPSHPVWIDPSGEVDGFSPPISDSSPTSTNPYSGTKVEERLGTFVRPNLLDNWYFGNPVNQRGLTEYGPTGYSFDRWILAGDGAPSVVAGDGKVTISDETSNMALRQRLESLPNGTYTLSWLESETKLYTTTGFWDGTNQICVDFENTTRRLQLSINGNNPAFAIHIPSAGLTADCIAVKLELGDTQTLAHQDENGNWVLNEIPDYGEQLIRCQRYYIKYSTVYCHGWVTSIAKNYHMALYTPIEMRIVPAVSMRGYVARKYNGYTERTGSDITSPTSLGADKYGNMIRIIDTVSTAVDTNNNIVVFNIYDLILNADL